MSLELRPPAPPTVRIAVDPRSEVPLYRQIAEQVTEGVAAGRLPPGTRLPTVRELADSLSVARVTVHHAYALLAERGLVESTVGRGTFIRESAVPAAGPAAGSEPAAGRFSWKDDLRSRGIEGGLAVAEPDPELTPAGDFLRLHRELAVEPTLLARYGAVEGERKLRQAVARRLAERGIRCRPDEVLITAGSTPALAALVQQLTRPGDRVLVEQTTYLGFLSLLHAADVEAVPVPVDAQGIDPEGLERALLRERPRFLYTVPTFHNPTGVSMSSERRREVLSLAGRYGLSILEDDVFHELVYDEEPVPPSLKAMAPDAEVVYVDSFSKCLLPGLRLGFMVPPPALRRALAARLEMAALTTSHLLQRTLAEYLGSGDFDRHLAQLRPRLRDRRDALMAGLEAHMPPGVRWTRPAGGLCCWLSLPPGGDYDDLARQALRRGVGYAPGWLFDPRGRPVAGLRLCLGWATRERIDPQMRVLGELVRQLLPDAAGHDAPRELVPVV